MKKHMQVILAVAFALGLITVGIGIGVTYASNLAAEATEKSGERKEQQISVPVNINVNEDGYYMLMGNTEINYSENGRIEELYMEDPALLAFDVSSEYNGGVWLLDLEQGNTTIAELTSTAEELRETGNARLAERIDAVIKIIRQNGPFTQAST